MIVEGHSLVKLYHNDRGVKDVSFSLQEGRIIALAGGNGAGKSTLIRLLIGQEKQTSGDIIWHKEHTVLYMPDDVQFPVTLTAEEIIQLLASFKKVGAEEQEIVLKRVGLWDVRKNKVQQFSKGMRQRLSLAQCLLGEGNLIVLDEPTNGLDPFWIAELKKILLEEKNKGRTILFSTHLLDFAETFADELLLLHEGKVLVAGEVSTILQEHNCQHLEELITRQFVSQ